MEISGKINRTAERYLELMRYHGLELSEPERQCIAHICHIGFMSPMEIRELPLEVSLTRFECEGLDKLALEQKLEGGQLRRPRRRRRVARLLSRLHGEHQTMPTRVPWEPELQRRPRSHRCPAPGAAEPVQPAGRSVRRRRRRRPAVRPGLRAAARPGARALRDRSGRCWPSATTPTSTTTRRSARSSTTSSTRSSPPTTSTGWSCSASWRSGASATSRARCSSACPPKPSSGPKQIGRSTQTAQLGALQMNSSSRSHSCL